MGSVNGLTAETMEAIRDGVIVDAFVNGSGHLILDRFDGSQIDTGSVIGPTGDPGATSEELDALVAASTIPVGFSGDYIGTVAPTNWLAIAGQTVASAQSLYPTLWGLVPTAWKSGTALLMPDSRRRVTVGYDSATAPYDTIGAIGGEETHDLTVPEMPGHVHSFNHDHGGAIIADDQGNVIGLTGVGGLSFATRTVAGGGSNSNTRIIGGDVAQWVGNTGNAGGGDPHNNMQPYIVMMKIIKAK